jgi:uncharacterized RDD family membrane protein YckC
MAMVSCPECQNQVSEQSLFCPNCGHPLRETPPDNPAPVSPGAPPPPDETIQIPASSESYLMPSPTPPPHIRYAGFLIRVAAYFLDHLILTFFLVSQIILSLLCLWSLTLWKTDFNPLGDWIKNLADHHFDESGIPHRWIWRCLEFAITILYFSILESSPWRATLGKRILGLKVSNEYGERIRFRQALWRYLCKFLSGCTCGFGFLMVALTQEKRGLHDFLAGTIVYYAGPQRQTPAVNPPPAGGQTPAGGPTTAGDGLGGLKFDENV